MKIMEKSGSFVEQVLAGEVEGKRPKGRPRKNWRDEFSPSDYTINL